MSADELFDSDELDGLDVNMLMEDDDIADLEDLAVDNGVAHTNNSASIMYRPCVTLLPAVRSSIAEPSNEAGLAPVENGGYGVMRAEGNPCRGASPCQYH